MTTYIIPSIAKDELQKKLDKLSKKAKTYGNHLDYSFGEEIVVKRNIYTVDPVTQTQYKTGEEKVFGIELDIESDIIRKGDYTVVGQIECLEYGKNLVKMFDDTPVEEAWYSTPLICEHCHINRFRRFVFIVKDETGRCKMVGKTCLKDYCGINPKLIAMSNEINDLILNDYDIDGFDFEGHGDYAYDVLDVIATANDIIKKYGYIKSCENNSTKSMLCNEIGTFEPSKESKALAKEMQEAFAELEHKDLTDFQSNLKNMLKAGYIKINNFGYLAYAPVAYKQMKEKQEREQHEAQGDYIGNVGEKITVELKESKLVTSWQTAYGWTYLYKFITTDGNTIVWKASGYKNWMTEPKRITGTVKDHKEYDGEKQTVLTRCKFC